MNKCALCIPRPGYTSSAIRRGYVDALKHLGWKVYICDPKTKLGCQKFIEEYGVRLIMTHSRFGIRQLPIHTINKHKVAVIVDALPLNEDDLGLNGPYEFAHKDEAYILQEIDSVVVHTRIDSHLWPSYMCGWKSSDIDLLFLPVAGNIIRALPPTCSVLTDVAMIANFGHRQDILKHLIAPLFTRLDLLGYSYQVFGDEAWKLAGITNNGRLVDDGKKMAHVYATAKVCPNVHTAEQVKSQICLNEKVFMIPLCGGRQIVDNPMAIDFLGPHCEIACSTTDYMNMVIDAIEDETPKYNKVRSAVEHVSNNHTYFNRLNVLFLRLGLEQFADEAKTEGQSVATRHCWGIDARLSAEERGITYEEKAIVG